MYLRSWLVVVIAALCAANKTRVRRVVGGYSTSINMFPHHVSLEKESRYVCGGSIISADFVLTTGHCVADDKVSYLVTNLKVRVGGTYAGVGGNTHDVKTIILHELYYKYPGLDFIVNDIALVELDHHIIFNSVRQPIELYNSYERVVQGQNATICGWGQVDRNFTSPLYLQFAEVNIVGNQACNEIYKNFIGSVNPGQICADRKLGTRGGDACFGDSGGALVIDDRQAGIISWGVGCAQFPGIYVDIPYYREWIRKYSGV